MLFWESPMRIIDVQSTETSLLLLRPWWWTSYISAAGKKLPAEITDSKFTGKWNKIYFVEKTSEQKKLLKRKLCMLPLTWKLQSHKKHPKWFIWICLHFTGSETFKNFYVDLKSFRAVLKHGFPFNMLYVWLFDHHLYNNLQPMWLWLNCFQDYLFFYFK